MTISRVVLRGGEVQRANGSYQYSWMDGSGKRRYVYAKTSEELRIKEEQIAKEKSDGIKTEAGYVKKRVKSQISVDGVSKLW